jgi:hypothetical protein
LLWARCSTMAARRPIGFHAFTASAPSTPQPAGASRPSPPVSGSAG